MSSTWRYIPYGALDIDLNIANDADAPPFAGISAQREHAEDAVEVALVGQPDGTVRLVITGTEDVDVVIVDDRESTGGTGCISLE